MPNWNISKTNTIIIFFVSLLIVFASLLLVLLLGGRPSHRDLEARAKLEEELANYPSKADLL